MGNAVAAGDMEMQGSDRSSTDTYNENSVNRISIGEIDALQYEIERRRRGTTGDFASMWDFCIVFPANKDGNFNDRGSQYIDKLRTLNFELFAYKSPNAKDCIFVLLRMPIQFIRAFAEEMDFKMLLDRKVLEDVAKSGNAERGVGPIDISHRPELVKYEPYELIFTKYSSLVRESLYWREEGDLHPFRHQIRLKIAATILQSKPKTGGENLKIRRYMRNGWLKACFCLHNSEKISEFNKTWLPWNVLPWNQPFDSIKEYFGEKIAFYFVFMGHYTKMLLFPALIGIPLQAYIFYVWDFSSPVLPVFSFIISMWAVIMLEFWKRKEKRQAYEWGMTDFEANERDRPDYRGTVIKSFITGELVRYYPTAKRTKYTSQSYIIVFLLICLVVGAVVGIYVMRYQLELHNFPQAQVLCSVVNALQIQFLNALYGFLANELSERENHRTDTQFEDSMIAKIFLFQFVNSYASFFYLAFVAQYTRPYECGGHGGCMEPLALNLAIIFGSRLISGNAQELLVPYILYRIKYNRSAAGKLLSRPEKEFLLLPYDNRKSSLEDYAEIAIQFGYNALFASALPIAAFFALVSNFVEIKGDAWKLLTLFQRPIPTSAEDIGTWQTIFLLISVAAVITNAGIVAFTSDTLDDISDATGNNDVRYWFFIGFQWTCFIFQAALMAIIPDVPEDVEIQMARSEFLSKKIIDMVPDDEGREIESENREDILIHDSYPFSGLPASESMKRMSVAKNPLN